MKRLNTFIFTISIFTVLSIGAFSSISCKSATSSFANEENKKEMVADITDVIVAGINIKDSSLIYGLYRSADKTTESYNESADCVSMFEDEVTIVSYSENIDELKNSYLGNSEYILYNDCIIRSADANGISQDYYLSFEYCYKNTLNNSGVGLISLSITPKKGEA